MTLDVPHIPSTSFLIHQVFGYVIFNHVDPDFFFFFTVSDRDSKSSRKIKISWDSTVYFTHELPGPRRVYRYQGAHADTKSPVV